MDAVAANVAVLRTLVRFFARTDGRDKLAKFLQNYCRYRKWYAAGAAQKRFKALQGSLSEFRSVVKFGKPFKNVVEAHELVAGRGGHYGALRPSDWVRLASLLADVGYKLGDNVEYLSHYGVLSFDEARCEAWSKTFQFCAYACDVYTGVLDLVALEQRRGDFDSDEAFERKRHAMRVGFLGDLADFLRVTPGFCQMYGIAGVQKHDGFSGVMGLIVGATGVWKIWQKCAASASHKLT